MNLLSRIVKVRLHGREIAPDYDYEEIKATAKVVLKKVIKMDKRSLYDGLNSLETDLDSSVTQLREIKSGTP